MKFPILFGIILLSFIGGLATSAHGFEVNYPTYSYRFESPPVYCIEEPVNPNLKYYEVQKLIFLAENSVSTWQAKLQNADSSNPSYWKMSSTIIASDDSRQGCDRVIYFVDKEHELHPEGGITLGTWFDASKKIEIYYRDISYETLFNVILHEIGHSIGLGHYTTDDDEVNKKFSNDNFHAPSIMITHTKSNPALMSIMPVDVQKVRSIYGSNGFYAFAPDPFKPTPQPTPQPESPLLPIRPFESLKISEDNIFLKKYDSKMVKITGQIKDEFFYLGHPVFILIIKPDHTSEVHRIPVTKAGYFELPLKFNSNYQRGTYIVEASYMEHSDVSKNFVFRISLDTPTITKFSQKPVNESPTTSIQAIVKEQDIVTINAKTPLGSNSFGSSTTWKQIGGDKVEFSSKQKQLSFQAPEVKNGEKKILYFQAISLDSAGAKKVETVKVTVIPKQIPSSDPLTTQEEAIFPVDMTSTPLLQSFAILKQTISNTESEWKKSYTLLINAEREYSSETAKKHLVEARSQYKEILKQVSGLLYSINSLEDKRYANVTYEDHDKMKERNDKVILAMENLKREIELAKQANLNQDKPEEKQCFLFWCW